MSGAAHTAVNGVYSHCGESDGVPMYAYATFWLLRKKVAGGGRCWYVQEAPLDVREISDSAKSQERTFYCLRSPAGTPPLDVQWERAAEGLLPGPYVTPISMAHAAPPSVLAPLQACEVGDYVRSNWAGR